MTLSDTLNVQIAAAMKAKDPVRLSSLRMLKAAIMNKGVEKKRDLDDAEVLQVVGGGGEQPRRNKQAVGTAGRHRGGRAGHRGRGVRGG